MAGSLQPRVKVWTSTEDVTASDLNAEFDNLLTAGQPLLIDDYSTDVTQMQVTTDPGEVGSESKATTTAGELARLRFMVKEITGEDQWYASPAASLDDLVNAVGTGLLNNRIASGRVRSGTQFPIFLVPNGAARTVKLDGTPTAFVYHIAGVSYSVTSDVTITGLTAAPSSNNTCLVNDAVALSDPLYTKYTGEYGSEIPVDAMGSEITALIGKFAAFKLVGATTEYFIGYVKSATSITKCRRGYFFDSADAPIPRSAYTDNDTITLMKLTWVFVKTDGTLTITYNNPIWSDDEPTSPTTGDYWFDTSADIWKKYDVSSFIDATATLIGVCIQDTSNTVGARSFEPFQNWTDVNTIELMAESNTQVKSRHPGSEINSWGTQHRFSQNLVTWDMTLDLDSGIVEAASTYYYFYITETGDKIISDLRPYDRREDLRGWYHPYQSWRCVGQAFNDGSSNLSAIESFYNKFEHNLITPSQTTASSIEVMERIVRLDSSGGAFTKHLPAAVHCRGLLITFVKTSSDLSAITLDPFGSETINGATTTMLHTQYESVTLLCDGSAWFIYNRYIPSVWSATTTSTITAVSGGVVKGTGTTVDEIRWKRIGDSMAINFAYKHTVAGTAGTGIYLIAIPASQTADSTDITVSTELARPIVGAAGLLSTAGFVKVYDSTNLSVITGDAGNNPQSWSSTWAPMSTASLVVGFEALVPITNWAG